MDKKANRDKRRKNLTFKSKPELAKPSKPSEDTKKPETSHVSENTLPNNWSKYEISENDDIVDGADFETLLHEPICNDSHFKFKSEQNWDADIQSQLQLNKYFTLDLKLLAEGISTVSFPKRHNYEESMFTYLELESIKKQTETNSQKYKKFLEKKFPSKNNEIIIKKIVDTIESTPISGKLDSMVETIETKSETIETKLETIVTKPETFEAKVEIDEAKEKENIVIKIQPKGQRKIKKHEDEVDDLLNLQFSQQNLTVDEPEIKAEDPLLQPTGLQKVVAPHSTVDLEQWLDDILDD